MALKDLLVYVDESENSLIRLRLAVDLAIRHGSRLTALHVREWSRAQLDLRKAAELGLVSAEGLHDLDRRIEASIDAAAERLRSTLAALTRDHDVEAELRSVEGEASIVVPQCARYADLCIVGRDQPEGASVNYTFSEQLLFVTGRPILFVPSGSFENSWPPYCRGLEFKPSGGPIAQRCLAAARACRTNDGPDGQSVGLYRRPPCPAGGTTR